MSRGDVAITIYGVLDNELDRMHAYLQRIAAEVPKDDAGAKIRTANYQEVYKRIKEIQDVMLKAAQQADPLIQEKVAELALTGEKK